MTVRNSRKSHASNNPPSQRMCEFAGVPTHKRTSILGFLDSLYAGCVAFAVAAVAPHIDKNGIAEVRPFLGKLLPMMAAILWIADDWICARLTLQVHGYSENSYRATFRLIIDLLIAGLSFGLVLASIPFRPFWYVAIFASISILGYVWARFLESELKAGDQGADGDVRAIILTHRVPSAVLVSLAGAIAFATYLSESPAQIAKVHRWSYWVAVGFPVTIFLWYKRKLISFHKEVGRG